MWQDHHSNTMSERPIQAKANELRNQGLTTTTTTTITTTTPTTPTPRTVQGFQAVYGPPRC
jgi:hypothetical protein